MDRLVAAGPEDRGAEDLLLPASATTFMKPCVSPFSTARPTRVIGRFADEGAAARARLPLGQPTRPSGGSM